MNEYAITTFFLGVFFFYLLLSILFLFIEFDSIKYITLSALNVILIIINYNIFCLNHTIPTKLVINSKFFPSLKYLFYLLNICIIIFYKKNLITKLFFSEVDVILVALFLFSLSGIILAPLDSRSDENSAIYLIFITTSIPLVVSFKLLTKSFKINYLEILSVQFITIGIVIYILTKFTLINSTFLNHYILAIVSIVEIAFSSIITFRSIILIRNKKSFSQAEALRLSRENERLIQELNMMLEKQVADNSYNLEKTLQELKDAQKQLGENEKMALLAQFATDILHEVKNPLNFTKTAFIKLKKHLNTLEKDDYFRQNTIDFEEVNELKQIIDEGIDRIKKIADSMLSYSRGDSIELMDINAIIKKNITLISHEIKNKIELSESYGEIPLIKGNPAHIYQATFNLLINAIYAVKQVEKKNHKGKISVETMGELEFFSIKIRDNGVGIKKENLNKIYERYYTTKKTAEGTGLGLNYVYNIVNRYGGKIEVESTEGFGTEFFIKIPYTKRIIENDNE